QKTQLASPPSQPPVVVPNPATPVLPIMPLNNPASNPGAIRAAQPTEIAPALNTPDSSRSVGNAAVDDSQATALVTPESQPVQFHLPIQRQLPQSQQPAEAQPVRQPQPAQPQRPVSQPGTIASSSARSGLSRRAFLFGGLVTAGVVVAGGITLFALQNGNHGLGGNGTTPTPATTGTHPVTGPTVLAQDDFQRNNQQFWGTASDGSHQWQQDAATSNFFSINNQMGQIQVPQNGTGGELTAILGQSFANGEVFVKGTVSNFNNSQLSAILRWTDDNHYYKVFLQGNKFNLIKRMNTVTPISKNIQFTTQAGVTYSLRFRIVGNTMEAKAWQSDQQEPTGWMFTVTDNNQQYNSGNGGIRTNVSAGVTVDITSFELLTANSL
ncbi:MAG TPA: hypothetical protein VGT44_13825, partial [Ktedonobacteraceae bacterium]|nr:hypothetical protein [Ktedonobacteraceae bacterium]